MEIKNSSQLVEEFKKSGEFDRLRRDLLQRFQTSDQNSTLLARVEEIAREKLDKDDRLRHKTRDAIHLDLIHDIDRYPVVEQAVSNFDYIRSPDIFSNIEESLHEILHDDGTGIRLKRVKAPATTPLVHSRGETQSPAISSRLSSPMKNTPLSTPMHRSISGTPTPEPPSRISTTPVPQMVPIQPMDVIDAVRDKSLEEAHESRESLPVPTQEPRNEATLNLSTVEDHSNARSGITPILEPSIEPESTAIEITYTEEVNEKPTREPDQSHARRSMTPLHELSPLSSPPPLAPESLPTVSDGDHDTKPLDSASELQNSERDII